MANHFVFSKDAKCYYNLKLPVDIELLDELIITGDIFLIDGEDE